MIRHMFLRNISKRFALLPSVRTAALQICQTDTALQNQKGREVVPRPRCLDLRQNGIASGRRTSRRRQRQVPTAVRANKSSGEPQGKAGMHEWGHDSEILVVMVL